MPVDGGEYGGAEEDFSHDLDGGHLPVEAGPRERAA
jgi:hypothetical protein